jgi:hypothetical protein
MKIPSVAYVHAHLVSLHGGQYSKLILRKKIFVETLDTWPMDLTTFQIKA